VTRQQLEHLLRAAAEIAADDEIVVIGSQAILGQFPDAPASMRVSVEADLYPLNHPERADLIDGSIGELSPFHETFGYYAQGVAEETARLPRGGKDRLVIIQNENTRGVKGLCLEVHDLLVSKAIAGREKELAFLADAARHRLARAEILLERLATVEADPALLARARTAIQQAYRGLLFRDVEGRRLAAALRALAGGLLVFDEALLPPLLRPRPAPQTPPEPLTPRELEVLQLLAQGLSNRRIAERLGISEHTAKFHVNSIVGKLGAQTRTDAAVRAARLGLVLL